MQPRKVDITAYLSTSSTAEHEVRRLFGANEPRVIFDIGACESEDSIRFARAFPSSRVYAFEPLPANVRIGRENIAQFAAASVELTECALSDQAGEATFHLSSGEPEERYAGEDWNYGNKSSSLLPPASDEPMHGWIKFGEKIVVRCDTLLAFCQARGISHIDFIHMDVQGAEGLVLKGAGPMLSSVGCLWLEVATQVHYQGQALKDDVGKVLRAAGFYLMREYPRDDGEGDQFWVSRRHPRFFWRWLSSRLGPVLRRLRTR